MKKKLAIFFVMAILVFSCNSMPAQAHSGSKAGAVVAGSLAGLAIGTVIGGAILSPRHHYAPPPPPRHNIHRPMHHHMAPPPPPRHHGGGFWAPQHHRHYSHSYVTFGW